MGKYDLLVVNIVEDIETENPVGTGVIISLCIENEAILLTAGHVIKNQEEVNWDNYKIIREIDGKRVPFDFSVKKYFVDNTNDLAVIRLSTKDEITSVKFLKPVEKKVTELVGFPGELKESPSVTKYPLTGVIRTVLPEVFVLEIQQSVETYTSGKKTNLNGISGGGIFFESKDNTLFLMGIENEVLTQEVLYNACNGISSLCIYDLIMENIDRLGLTVENIKLSFQIESLVSVELAESELYGKWFTFLSDFKLNMAETDIRKEFKDGVAAHPDHIRFKCNIPREYWITILKNYFQYRNSVIIRGASGQGKSTLAYDFLISHYPENKIICIDSGISEECIIEIIKMIKSADIYNECIAYMDVKPNDISWYSLCKQWNRLDIKTNLLISVREEDFNRVNIDRSLFVVPDIQLKLTRDEAETLFSKYENLQFISFDESWSAFGEHGPLMEYIYLLNHSQTMKNRLKSQVLNIENSDMEDNWINFLSVIALAGRYDTPVNIQKLLQKIPNRTGRSMIRRFESEFFVRVSDNGQALRSVHPLRSKLLFEVLIEELFVDYKQTLLEVLSIVNGNFQYAVVDYITDYGMDEEFLKQLSKIEYSGIISYASVLKSLLWYEVYSFRNLNHHVIIEGNKTFGNVYGLVAKADVTGLIGDTSIGENLFLHLDSVKPGIHEKYKELFHKFNPPVITYKIVDYFLDATKDKCCSFFSYSAVEFTDFSFVLFWMAKRNIYLDASAFSIDKLRFDEIDNLEECLNLLVGFWEQKWNNQFEMMKSKIAGRLFRCLSVISIQHKNDEIFIQSFIGLDEDIKSESTLGLNEKCMTIVNAFRRFDPASKKYNVKLVGMEHLGIHVLDTEKHISADKLYYSWVVQLNATFRRMNEYEIAPDNWKTVLNNILDVRNKVIKLTKEFLKYMDKFYKKGIFSVSRDFSALEKELKQTNFRTLFSRPKTVLDKNGISDTNKVVQDIPDNNALNIGFQRKESIEKICRDYFIHIDNFFNNYVHLICECRQGEERTQPSRIAYYEIAQAYHILKEFQGAFDEFFSTFDYEFDNADEYNTMERLAALIRHMFHNKYYSNRSIGYNTLEQVKQLRRKIDVLIESTIPNMPEVQDLTYCDGIMAVTIEIENRDSFFTKLLQYIHSISGDMNTISVDGHCLLEKLDLLSVTLKIEGHVLFRNLRYNAKSLLCHTEPKKLMPESISDKVCDLNAELKSKEDAFISLYLFYNNLSQILAMSVEISEALNGIEQECIIHATVDRIDEWLCELIRPLFLCIKKIFGYMSSIVKDYKKEQLDYEIKILELVECFSLNPMLKPKHDVYLNPDMLKALQDLIQKYELSFADVS